MAKKVFVIYGRDTEAHRELGKFIHAVGLEELAFESVASGLGASPFIADIVMKGIAKADAVIALFTPDEQAVLHDSKSGRSLAREQNGSRWQARPNVMFEAGVAYGKSGREPIMTVLGADVSLFSDVAGVHFVRLDGPNSKAQLFDRLTAVVGRLRPRISDWEHSAASGDFEGCVRRRWSVFDEVEELQRNLGSRHVCRRPPVPLLKVVANVALSDLERDWARLDARTFIDEVAANYDETTTDLAYWWLIVYGFLQFDNVDNWGTVHNATWDDSVDNARLAPRGVALIERLRALANPDGNVRPSPTLYRPARSPKRFPKRFGPKGGVKR